MEETSQGIRVNKYLSAAGVCSRREADRQIKEGAVQINDRTAQMGDRVFAGDMVYFQGSPVTEETERILLAVNKPRGIVCTAQKQEKDNIVDFVHYPMRIYPMGRLDKDSSGLILMTNQGGMVNQMLRSANMHEREYLVTVNKPLTDPFLRGLAGGVPLVELGVTTRKCEVEQVSKRKFRIILTQGFNRQIRRMCEYFGYRVVELKRVRIMNILLGDLAPGAYRDVTEAEYSRLLELLAHSKNTPAPFSREEQYNGRKKKNAETKRADRISQQPLL